MSAPFLPVLFAASFLGSPLWYSLPLLVAVSLVYGATRHEAPRQMLEHAGRTAYWMLSFIGVVFAILVVVSWLV